MLFSLGLWRTCETTKKVLESGENTQKHVLLLSKEMAFKPTDPMWQICDTKIYHTIIRFNIYFEISMRNCSFPIKLHWDLPFSWNYDVTMSTTYCQDLSSLFYCCCGLLCWLIRCLSTSRAMSVILSAISKGNTFSSSDGGSRASNCDRSRFPFM